MQKLISVVARIVLAGILGLQIQSASAQSTPSSDQIYKKLSKPSAARSRAPERRISKQRLIRSKSLRRTLPTVNINSINFAFGSSKILANQRWKVRNIANAMLRFKNRRAERFLIEGHTDAVGSRANNQRLSVQRARSLKRALVGWFGVPSHTLFAAGYGEDFLIVPSQRAEWRNRRVVIRRATGVLR